jgi:glycosyltransferase involved in cell wall biosynthesis
MVWLCSGRLLPNEREESAAVATNAACETIFVLPKGAQPVHAPHSSASARRTVAFDEGPWCFAGAANHGAAQASGDYLVFLDDSLMPTPGWLDHMLDGVRNTTVDAVTPRLLAANGSLQAAGSIIWSDGTCEPLGRGQNADLLEYSFRRAVPCFPPSGLLIRRATFEACGGFDVVYASAGYAAADLCFSLVSRGREAVYQPLAIVRHLDEQRTDAEEDSTADRLRFRTRWVAALTRYPPPSSAGEVTERRLLAARDVVASERLLIVDDRVPGPDRGSGDPRMRKLLLEIVRVWPSARITFVATTPTDGERYSAPLLDAGVEVIYGREWKTWFESRRYHYGLVIVSRPQQLDDLIQRTQPQALRVYDAEALVFRRLERMLPYISDGGAAAETARRLKDVRSAEFDYMSGSDLILCVTPEERRIARAIATDVPAVVVPHWIVPSQFPPGFFERRDLLFFGGFMSGPGGPNEDALLYLAADVLPRIHAQDPFVVLHVVGADPTPAVSALQSDRIHVVGYAADPAVWMDRVRVHIAPMRFGSGVKLKLIDTMAAGLPFVTTAIGAEGLRLGSLRHVTVSDSPDGLAERTLALFRNERLWTDTQRELLSLARRRFGRARFQRSLVTAMSHVGLPPPAG